jgi:hypothetical protein
VTRRDECERFEPRRQLPRHDIAFANAMTGESGRGALGLGLVLRERERAAGFVDGHHRIRRCLDSLFEELPQVASINHVATFIAVSLAQA